MSKDPVQAYRFEQVQNRARRISRNQRRIEQWRDQLTGRWPMAQLDIGVDGLSCDLSQVADQVTDFETLRGMPISRLKLLVLRLPD